ncbi:MAG: hypothetical protein RJA33_134 [Actinomycetota bacterium]|jgi:hypothetical protein
MRQIPKGLLLSAVTVGLVGSFISIVDWILIFYRFPGLWGEVSFVSKVSFGYGYFSIAFNLLLMIMILIQVLKAMRPAVEKLCLTYVLFSLASYPITVIFWAFGDQDLSLFSFFDYVTSQLFGFMYSYSSFPYLNLNSFVVISGHYILFVYAYFVYSSWRIPAKPILNSVKRESQNVTQLSVPSSEHFIDQIEKLKSLHESGVLTSAEFTAAKKRVLGQ